MMARIKNTTKRSSFNKTISPQKNKELGQASSSANTSHSKSLREVSSESSSGEISHNQHSQTTSTNKRNSKRKSLLPKRRKSSTEEYRTSHKYAIDRFGHKEQCTRKQFFELKFYQKSTHLLIPRLPFSRLIREILLQHLSTLRIQLPALMALQEAAEIYLVDMFGLCNLLAAHAKRKTVNQKDMALIALLKNSTSGNLYDPRI